MSKSSLSDQFSRNETLDKRKGTSWVLIIFFLFIAIAPAYALLFFYDDIKNIIYQIKLSQKQKTVAISTPPPKPLHKKWDINPSEIKPKIFHKETKEKIYSWVDENGIKQFSNVQPEFDKVINGLKVSESISNRKDPIIIQNNRVLVPVTLAYKKRKKSTFLVLDTGASTTCIHEDFAKKFGQIRYRQSSATVADGRRVNTKVATFDYIEVGPYTYKNIRVDIIPYKQDSHVSKGLLGMNFLRHFKYQIDHKNKVIKWL